MDICSSTDEFLNLEAEWNSLLHRSRVDTIFLTWQWQKTWWDCLGEGGRLLIVTVRDRGELVGLAPFCASSTDATPGTLRLIGEMEVSDYLDIIAANGMEEAVYESLWTFLLHQDTHTWRSIDLHNVPDSSPTLTTLGEIARRTEGVRVQREVEDVCPVIDLPPTWEAYLSLLKKKQRQEVRRKMRKISREAIVHWYCVTDEATLTAEVDDFIELHRKSAGEKKAFMDERMGGFFQSVARVIFDQGWLKLAFLLVNDLKSAAMLCFDYNGSIMVYNSGYDPQLHPSLSSGIVLLAYCIQDAIAKGRKKFDFLRGSEEYKYRFGGQDTEVYNLRISR